MRSAKRSIRIIAVMMIAMMVLSGISVSAASSSVKITGYTAPDTVTQGSSFVLKGKITSNKKIKRVEVGVAYYDVSKWTSQKYDNSSVNAKSFDISKADPYIRFGKLSPGKYFYRIYAHTSDGKVHIVLNKSFTVKKKAAAKTSTSKTSTSTKTATSTKAAATKTSTTKTTSKNKKTTVKFSGYNVPGTYKVGRKFSPKGTITSNKRIKRVEIGIVFAPTNKWTQYKYDNNIILGKSFNVSKAASSLKFDKLPGGTYRYRIYVHTADGVQVVLNKKFTVKPSNKPQKAVNWAKKIANDNSFTYGAKPAASALGCYFCGTNCGPVKYYKPKGYEKTYVCLTFIGAAYAHGAKDPEILDKCRRGKMTMWETDRNFTDFSCWMKIGSCRDLTVDDLQIGDVIVQWSDGNDNYGHVCMYVGGDNVVEACGGGWGAGSIAVNGGTARYLSRLGSNRKNYVMRYRY